jgi:hypothetical protein
MPSRRAYLGLLLCSCFAPAMALGGTVYDSVAPLSGMPGDFQYSYYLSGFDLFQYEELDFVFPANLFLSLSSPVANPHVVAQVFQPNVPIRAAGGFTAEASPALGDASGARSIDAAYSGSGLPGAQTYFIDHLHGNGILVGNPVEAEDVPVPEPGAYSFWCFALVLWAVGAGLRRGKVPLISRNPSNETALFKGGCVFRCAIPLSGMAR